MRTRCPRYVPERLGESGLLYPWPLFRTIAEQGPIAQAELSERLGLTRGTCNLYCQALEAARLIRRTEVLRGRPGRPTVRWTADAERNLLAGVACAVPRMYSMVWSLDGKLVHEQVDELDDLTTAEAVKDRLTAFCRAVRNVEQERSARVRLAIAALPGLLDRESGRVVLSANVPALNGLDFEGLVREALNVPALAAYLGLAFYYGEAEGARADEEIMVVYCDLGIGAVFGQGRHALSHRPHDHPARPASPGLGHVRVVRDGRPCHCGGRGCLEAYASGWAMLERLRPQGARTVDDLLRLVREHQPEAVAAAEEAMEALGAAVAWPIHALGLDRLIFTGALAPLVTLAEPAFRRGFGRILTEEETRTLWPKVNLDSSGTVRRGTFLLAREALLHPQRFHPPWTSEKQVEAAPLAAQVARAAWEPVVRGRGSHSQRPTA